ncbi:MAG: glycosyltransferase family 4 protein [Pseudomonadota bacterium]
MLDQPGERSGPLAHPPANDDADASLRPLRILFTSYRSHPFSGGQGVYLRHLTKALSALGHSVDVISGPPYPDLAPSVGLIKLPSLDLYATDAPLRALRPRHLTSLTDLYEWAAHTSGKFPEPYTFGRRLKQRFEQDPDALRGYDVVHDNQTLSWGVLALEEMGAPLVATLHHPITVDRRLALDAAKGWRPKKVGLRLLIRRWHSFLPMQMKVARQIKRLVTISDSSREDFAEAFGLERARIERVYLGIDTEQFRLRPDIAREPETLICTASADVALKGLAYLIEAAALLRQKWPRLKLKIIGALREGPTKRRLKALAMEDATEFMSGLSGDALSEAYARAAIAIVPSLYEGFGFPAGEAMATGAPVIATTGGALPEVVGDAGLLVPPGDAAALASAIDRLLSDAALRAELGAAGHRRVEERFTWTRCAEAMTRIYAEAIADAHR